MEKLLGCGDVARLTDTDKPRRIADLLYQVPTLAERTQVVLGRRVIPESLVPEIRAELERRGWVRKTAGVASV